MTTYTCERCDRTVPDAAPRSLWARSMRTALAVLCDDCNDVVQGPDHARLDGNHV